MKTDNKIVISNFVVLQLIVNKKTQSRKSPKSLFVLLEIKAELWRNICSTDDSEVHQH